MPAPLFLSGPCEICGQKTSGRHFGVMSCRACAAFFKRAATSPKKKIECPKGNCLIFDDGKFPCKKCRLKRCIDVGMDVSKFQTNRDLISSSNKFIKRVTMILGPPQSLSTFLGRPTFILCCEPDKASHIKTIIDESPSTLFQSRNNLEVLAQTLENMRMKLPDRKITQLRKFGKEEFLYVWEQSFLRVAKWFTNLPEFNELENDIKLEIVKNSWICWTLLEKLTETADYQRRKIFGNEIYMCGNDACVDFTNYEVDLEWCTNYSLDQLTFYLISQEKNCRERVRDLIDLAPNNIELSYMLLQVSLYHAGKRAQGKVLEATDRLLQIQADHLHDYYTNKLKMTNYSSRLAKIMKVNRGMESDMRERAEKNRIAQVFDILKVDFSHPDVFDWP